MSLYALSLFTQRQLLIDMTTPCSFTQMILPNQVNWNSNDYKLNGKKNSHLGCIDKPSCMKIFDDIIDSSANELDNDILTVNVNNDWLTYFSQNPKFKTRIKKLGYSPEKFKLIYLFKDWYNKLFKFSPDFQMKYDLIKSKADLEQNTLLCAQIRIGGSHYGEWQFNSYNVTKDFWKFLREHFMKDIKENKWKLLVITEMSIVQKEAVEEFSDANMVRVPGEFSHMDRLSNLGNNCSKIEKSILEFKFMEYCEKAAISASGYGKLGMWSRDQPIKDVFVFEKNTFTKMSYDDLPIG